MSVHEIIAELPKLSEEERELILRQLLRTGEDLLGTCFQEPLTYWETDTDGVRRKPES
jgi:hypothetical protein